MPWALERHSVRILFVGDVVGKPGVQFLTDVLPGVRRQESIELAVVNGENADGGSGINPSIYRRMIASGVDCVTLGDHIYKKKDIIEILENQGNIVKPANFPEDAPGKRWVVVKSETGRKVAVFSLMGRVFMRPVDCPFKAAERVLAEIPEDVKIRFCDFHAEATSDKQLMGRFLEGRVSACLGTHTHVATADEQILPGGTAFQCDVGMTGPHESILGRQISKVMEATITFKPLPFLVAQNDVRLNGAIVDIDPKTGRAQGIRRFCVREKDADQYLDDY